MKKLLAFDLVFFAYLAILSAMVVAVRPPGAWIYLAYHAATAGMVLAIVWAHGRHGGRFWTFARHWYVVIVIPAAFRELHWLVPAVHPFGDLHWDRVLASLDARWFGDVDALVLGWPPVLVDVLHLCYWFYFPSMVILGGLLYARGGGAPLREYLAVLLAAMFISYLGYFAVPAIGPHHFYPVRPASLDGWILGGPMHKAILAAEWEMPDCFPSGHTLMSLVVVAMAWRHHRPSARWMALPALGCIVATVALRYHYVVDVLASFLLFPAVAAGAAAFNAWWERRNADA